ncbi:MAG: hypothetical protein QOG59_2855, partial [Solirubrobacteraceae bacterium]|nr:hypothetical protein [Solirubrobacteraceae bacterium]
REAVGSMWTAPVAAAAADAALWDGRPLDARSAVAAALDRREETDDSEVVYLAPLIAAGARAEAELAAQARAVGDGSAESFAVARAASILEVGRGLVAADPLPEALLNVELASLEAARAAASASASEWADLAERWAQHGCAFPVAYCRWRQAELTLSGGGARGDVPAVLARAHAVAVELGAAPLQREIEDLARRARIALDAAVETAPEASEASSAAERVGLTARELDVLRLMAGGATNREIAARLYISQKTVTVHVTRILAKLDARTRVEAAGVAQRLGLLEPAAS